MIFIPYLLDIERYRDKKNRERKKENWERERKRGRKK